VKNEAAPFPGPTRRFPLLLAGVLIAVEATFFARENGALRTVAAWCWLACAALVLVTALATSAAPLFRREFWASRDVGWFLAAYLAPVVLLTYGITGYAHTQINDEAVQQVASGLDFLETHRDFGIFGAGFVGYPARQYLLAALPSLILGKGLVALRAGFGLLHIASYLAFLCALSGFLSFRKARAPMLLAGVGGVLAVLGSFSLLYARLFEQTTVPAAALCLFLAGVLRMLSRPGPIGALWILWSIGFMPYAYTPALSGWVFGMAVLAWLFSTGGRDLRPTVIAALLYGAAAFAVSTLAHAQLPSSRFTLGSPSDTGNDAWSYRLATGLHAAFGLDESLIPAPLVLGLLVALGQSLRKRDGRLAAATLWAVGTVVISLLLRGYWRRVPEFDIQRAMVVLPVLSLGLILWIAGQWTDAGESRLFRGLLAATLVFMVSNAAWLVSIRRAPRDYVPSAVTDKEEATMLVVNAAGSGAKTVYVPPPLFIHLEDTLRYFSPSTQVSHAAPPPGEHRPGNFIISYAGTELFVPEDPFALYTEHPVRFSRPRPYLRISPE
jgi:hypothetical protein